MLQKTLILNKKVGETPLQVLEKFRQENSEYEGVKMAYAGRLDPMAEGVLLVLVGEECKNRAKYLGLDKEYEFEILLGFRTDSQDVLGLAEYKERKISDNAFFRRDKKAPEKSETNFLRRDKHLAPSKVVSDFSGANSKKLSEILLNFVGEHEWKYPIFSSKTVQGKPLFLWALENKISEIEIPRKEIEIYELEFLGEKFLKKDELQKKIFEKINSLPEVKDESKKLGKDFRRKEIRTQWNEIFSKISPEQEFSILKFRCQASSGTYMRVLAEKIAQELGEFGLAYSIKRTNFLDLS